MKTLVVSPNWVGDCVMALPVFAALAGGDRRLVPLARGHLLPLLRLFPDVDGAVARAKTDRQTVAELASAGFDEAVILPNSFRSAWLPYRAGIPVRRGYSGHLRRPLLAPVSRRGPGRRPQVEDYRELLTDMGVEQPESWVPRIELAADRIDRGAQLLRRSGIADGGPVLGLFAGAEFGPSKQWPETRFVELSRELRRRLPASSQVLIAGPKEVPLAVRLHEATARLHPVLGPDLDLADLAAVLSRLDLLVTNDSGPMHLAAAVGVPCVALFGPTDPRRTSPAGSGHTVLHTGRWCSPCFRRKCPLRHHKCMTDIRVEYVAEACERTLAG